MNVLYFAFWFVVWVFILSAVVAAMWTMLREVFFRRDS